MALKTLIAVKSPFMAKYHMVFFFPCPVWQKAPLTSDPGVLTQWILERLHYSVLHPQWRNKVCWLVNFWRGDR